MIGWLLAVGALQAGQLELQRGHLREAHAQFVEAARTGDAESLALLGHTTLEHLGDASRAEELLLRAASLAPGSSRVQLLLGGLYAHRIVRASIFGKLRLAPKLRGAFERAVQLDPGSVDARLALLRFSLHAPGIAGGGVDKARAQAKAIAALDPFRGLLADAEIAAHQGGDAAALLERAREAARKAAERAEASAQLVRLALDGRRPVEAVAQARREVADLRGAADPFREAAALVRLSEALRAAGDAEAALEAARRAVRLDPLLPAARRQLQAR